jgi:Sulfatase-modifying factor enzyme 1
MNSRAQASTEYLIILAIVIIVALVAVGAMGGIPGLGSGTSSCVSSAYWRTSDLAVLAHRVDANGSAEVVVKNNMVGNVRLVGFELDGVELVSGAVSLKPGQTATLSGSVGPGSDAYAFNVTASYYDANRMGPFFFSELAPAVPSCPADMAYISAGGYCIDKYEASNSGGLAMSVSGATPWMSINQTNAKAKCIAAGKHLCTGGEWFNAANLAGLKNATNEGTGEYYNCNTNSAGAVLTGSRALCKSDADVYDMVGNLWEWTDESYASDPTPSAGTGYVTGWDYASNLPTGTSGTPNSTFGDDYYFDYDYISGTVTGFRGGSWDNGAYAGAFAVDLIYTGSISSTNIGFRCCK